MHGIHGSAFTTSYFITFFYRLLLYTAYRGGTLWDWIDTIVCFFRELSIGKGSLFMVRLVFGWLAGSFDADRRLACLVWVG